MIKLVPMSNEEFDRWLTRSIQIYAQEKVRAGNWLTDDALERAQTTFDELLPEGVATQNQYFISIEDEALSDIVGLMWIGVDDQYPKPSVYINDLTIFEQYQRQGYGTQALIAMEAKALEMGIFRITLQVFGQNQAARGLYEKAGFKTTNVFMMKDLEAGDK